MELLLGLIVGFLVLFLMLNALLNKGGKKKSANLGNPRFKNERFEEERVKKTKEPYICLDCNRELSEKEVYYEGDGKYGSGRCCSYCDSEDVEHRSS